MNSKFLQNSRRLLLFYLPKQQQFVIPTTKLILVLFVGRGQKAQYYNILVTTQQPIIEVHSLQALYFNKIQQINPFEPLISGFKFISIYLIIMLRQHLVGIFGKFSNLLARIQHTYQIYMLKGVVLDVFIVLYKNILLDLKNPLQLLGQFIMPLQVCLVIYFTHYQKDSIISLLFSSLLPFYIGNLSSSLIRKFSVYFITERQEKFGMYQRVLGLSTTGYFLGNLAYTYLFTTMVISPVWLILTYYNFDFQLIYFFASYVICANCFQLMLISFFKDPKVCSQVVGMICSMSVFLYYLVDLNNLEYYSVFIMMLPQPGFALSIIGSSKKSASMMLLSAKIFIVIYAWRQFEIHPLQHCKNCINKLRGKQYDMNEEIQLESLDSQAKIIPRLLSIKNLTKKYNKVAALDNFSLTIAQGEIMALLGRNGAGKTTLIDIITGMQEVTEGQVDFNKQLDPLRIGVCYQQQILYEQLTIQQITQYYIYIKRQQNTELQRVLNLVELYDQRDKKVKELSGGMKRRLSLAIAIIGQPPILILDEPTSGLDPHSRRAVWQIVNKLKNVQQKSILLTTHHLDQAQALADRVCVIERGKSLVLGSPLFIKKRFGIGYILTIYGSQSHVQEQQTTIKKYTNLEIQMSEKNIRKYVLRVKDQNHFGQIIQELEKIQDIQITLQLNTLQEAFLGILNDPELVNQPELKNRIIVPLSRSPVGQRKQFRAMLLKNIYLLKRSPLKSLILYNLNLIFLIIGIVVANLFKHIVQNSKDNAIAGEAMAAGAATTMRKVMLLQGYYFSIGIYIYNAVYQKEKRIINVLKVRGMSWVYYWSSQFLMDYVFFIMNLGIVYLIVGDVVNFPFMAMFGLSLILYCYCCSFLFSNSQKATKYFPLVNFAVGFLLPILNQLHDSSLKSIAIYTFKYIYPFSAFQDDLIPSEFGGSPSFNITPFIVQTIIYILLLICIEIRIISRITNRKQIEKINQPIKLKDVKKIYKKQQALRSLSLTVDSSEILGLLGPNGAGKSTTFKILTNLQQPTSGQVYLEHQTHLAYHTSFLNSGVCYQDDTLWQILTGRQILTIFGHLVGIQDVMEQSLYLSDRLEIQTLDRKFQKLSGGNKRKCCMAVCLMGQPQCSYLDECSTGLDPMSRRAMVKTIATHDNSTIVFTTHSMNEAENLCKKIAILIKGQVKQYGTLKQLKDKYHPSYFIEAFYEGQEQSTVQKIKEVLPDLVIRTQMTEEKKLKCQIPKCQIALSKLYFTMMSLKRRNDIHDFSVYEPNLQDVYLQIIKQ